MKTYKLTREEAESHAVVREVKKFYEDKEAKKEQKNDRADTNRNDYE